MQIRSSVRRFINGFLAFFMAATAVFTTGLGTAFATPPQNGPEILSVNNNGNLGDLGTPLLIGISSDGRYVGFYSRADNLGNQRPGPSVFVRDRQTGTTQLVDVNTNGEQDNTGVADYVLSGDGRHVVFSTDASNMSPDVPGGPGQYVAYERNLDTGITQPVSYNQDNQITGSTSINEVSDNGQVVLFAGAGSSPILVRDIAASQTTAIPFTPGISNTSLMGVILSSNGRYVTYTYYINHGGYGVNQYDRTTGVTTPLPNIITDPDLLPQLEDTSADGRYIFYYDGRGNVGHSFRYDVVSGALDSIAGGRVKSTADGQTIVYVGAPINSPGGQVYVRNFTTGRNYAVSVTNTGDPVLPGSASGRPYISEEGTVAMVSGATNFGPAVYHNADVGPIAYEQAYAVSGIEDLRPPAVNSVSVSPTSVLLGGNATLSASVTSGGRSGIASVEYYVDADPGQGNGTALTLANGQWSGTLGAALAAGTHTVHVRAVSRSGTWSNEQTAQLTVTLPTLDAPTNLTAPSPTTTPQLTWNASAHADQYQVYRDNTQISTTATTSFTDATATNGTHSYFVKAVDSTGNYVTSAPSNTVTVAVDTVGPVVTATLSPAANAAGWNNSNVTVTFSCSDTPAGVQSCPGPITVTNEGQNQSFTRTATDNLGNSTNKTVQVSIDKTAPTVGTPTVTPGLILFSGNLAISANASDSLSGVSGGEYYFDTDPGVGQGKPMTYASGKISGVANITTGSGLTPGMHRVYVRSRDAAGNWSTTTSTMFIYV